MPKNKFMGETKMKKYCHFGLILTFILIVALSGCGGGNGGGGNPPHAPVITTIAGTGTAGYNGDNGPATSARIGTPYGVAVDSFGDIYIADTDNHCIRKVNLYGVIIAVAGTGTDGYNGDGDSATSAQLNTPRGVAVDSDRNIYIADTFNHRIRKVDYSSGMISTIAGTGTDGYNGDDGLATSIQLRNPYGVAVDSYGNIYIADAGHHRIRKVDSSSGMISTIAGTGTDGFSHGYSGDGGPATSAQLYLPRGVAVDSSGNIYIADNGNHRIRKVDSSGVITTIIGTGIGGYNGDNISATSAQLKFPNGVAVDSNGNIYIADAGNYRIRKVK
jgi:sugar lactone lactonase YvrE